MTALIPFLSVPPMLFVSVLFHELGHWVAVWLTRHRNTEIAVQGVCLTRDGGGWRWHLEEWNLGGHVRCHLIGLENYRNRLVMVSAAGPLMNALMILLAGVAIVSLGDSPYLRIWIFANLSDIAWSFMRDEENDFLHIRQALGKAEGSKEFLASHVLYAEGADPEEQKRLLAELGFAEAPLTRRYGDLVEAQKFAEAADTLLELLKILESKDDRTRVWYECEAAFRFAYRLLAVEKAVRLLPPETRARAYDCEDNWLRAAAMIAMAEARWEDVRDLSQRALKVEGAHDDTRWFEMAGKLARRHLEHRPRTKA